MSNASSTEEKIEPYKGRPLSEFRIDSNLDKAFSEKQRLEMKTELKAAANEAEIDPKYGDIYRRVGIIKNTINDFEGALDAWLYWHYLSPGNSVAPHNIGYLYAFRLNDKENGEKYLKKALALDHDPYFYMQLADVYRYFFKDEKKMTATMLESLDKNPNNKLDLLLYMASYYRDVNNGSEALKYYKELYSIDPRPEIKEEIDRL